MTSRQRVLSGMRPTGKLHLGNYLGALDNWVRLQDEYDCFYFVASWHALTTDAENSGQAPESTIQMAADWLGAGLDPQRSTLFIQSLVPEHAELYLLFAMVTPLSWLERVPTYKEMVEQLGIASPSYGLLGYPLLQAADILMYKPQWVPVSERLPLANGNYLVTSRYFIPDEYVFDDNPGEWVIRVDIEAFDRVHRKFSCISDERTIFAWMALPVPFHTEAE